MPEPVYVAYSIELIERVIAYLEEGPHRLTRPLIDGLRNQGRPAKMPTVSATLREDDARGSETGMRVDNAG